MADSVHCGLHGELQHSEVLRDHDHRRPRDEQQRHRRDGDASEPALHVPLSGLEQAHPDGARPLLHHPHSQLVHRRQDCSVFKVHF